MELDQCTDLAALLAQGEENHELARRFGSVASSPPQLEPEALHASYTEDFDAGARDRWDDDAENCSICSALLGRRRLRPRHHCRICGRCVCASCSPNLALMPGSGRELQRACTPCMAVAYKAPALKSRISQLGARLLGLSSASSSARAVPIGSLDAMLVLCEDAIGPLEGMQTQLIASQAEAARFAAEVEQERVRCRHLEARLRSATEEIACLRKRVTSWLDQQEHCDTHAASTCEKDGRLQPASLEEALQDCAASVSRLEALPAPAKGEALATAGTCANEEAWEPNTRHCSLCCASLGKRFWRPRHHCRFCGRCVCGACSRSFIGTANQPWQRCCAKCALAVTQSPWLQQRLARMAEKMACGLGIPTGTSCRGYSLDEVLMRCEEALCLRPGA